MLTPTRLDELVRACVLAGFVPVILAPLLFPFLVAYDRGGLPLLDPLAYLAIAFFALIFGLGMCLVVGLPAIFIADKVGWNNPIAMAAVGAALPVAADFVYRHDVGDHLRSTDWAYYLFIAVIGASCGAVASRQSLRHKC